MDSIELNKIIEYIENTFPEEEVGIASYDGGNDSGGATLDILLPSKFNSDEFLQFLEDKLLEDQYGSYAFEGSCNGEIFYRKKDKTFYVEGSESYEEWTDYKNEFKVE